LRALLSIPENFGEHYRTHVHLTFDGLISEVSDRMAAVIMMKMVYDIDIKPINDRFNAISYCVLSS
jgi:hypothetical protein